MLQRVKEARLNFKINLISMQVAEVPHLQCSLRENPKFLPNKRKKNNTMKVSSQLIFVLNICLCNIGLALKGKNY
jgi:hypothetical protein